MLKTKVMEDLDALLADLQSTTSHISTYQQSQQPPPPPPVAPPVVGDDDSRESTPPPLPPPPPPDVYDDLNDQPLYEPQRVKHQYHSSVSSTAVPRSHAATHQGPPPASFTPPPPPAHPPPPVGPLTSTPNTPPVPPPKPVKPVKPMSALSSNLTELDMLLQDLSSAQFMAEVDRRNAANVSNHGTSDVHVQPIVPVASRRGDCSVDSLLIELENTAGRPLPSHQSMESIGSHYEAVRPVQQRNVQTLPQQAKAPGAASSATRELEDLMASLSEFRVSGHQVPPLQHMGEPPYAQPHKAQKMTPYVTSQPQSTPLQHVGEPPYAQPNKMAKNAVQSASMVSGVAAQGPGVGLDQGLTPAAAGAQTHDNHLETMLGNLNTDMNRQGIMTIPKGHCAACTKPIVGQVITALGRIWHPEHFTCSHCKDELGTRNFFERDGLPYCERDYHNLFSPRCGHCNGPILDKCVTALDKTWHPEHFFCATCGRLFGEDGFHEKDGKAFCRDDYFEMFAPKCGGCGRPIMDNYISALSRQWHPECFICTDCRMPFGGGSFFDHEGMPYCETHYHAKRGSLCAGCHKPITGRCITAMYKKFHPEHFVCAFCLKQLNKGTFKEQNDKPYCHQCFVKLFG